MEWKLCRQRYGTEEFIFSTGSEVTLGRGTDNNVILSSAVISRNHCVIKVYDDEVTIEDLKSSNGVYIGLKRINPYMPYSISDNEIIGFGWMDGAQLVNVKDSEKYIFKLIKIQKKIPIINRIQYQDENSTVHLNKRIYPILEIVKKEKLNKEDHTKCENIDIVNCTLTDSDVECLEGPILKKKKKLDPIEDRSNRVKQEILSEDMKLENDEIQFDAFSIKQEYLGDIEEPIEIDSNSDSESENWYLRLSQSSPGKTFTKLSTENNEPIKETNSKNNSYRQLDDVQLSDYDNDIYYEDLISLVPTAATTQVKDINCIDRNKQLIENTCKENAENCTSQVKFVMVDHTDSAKPNDISISEKATCSYNVDVPLVKKIQIIEPLCQPSKRKPHHSSHTESKKDKKGSSIKDRKHSSKNSISKSQKDERKKKLKEIATKLKESEITTSSKKDTTTRSHNNIKVTKQNRGEFLSHNIQIKKKKERQENKEESNKTSEKEIKKKSDHKENQTSPSEPKSRRKSKKVIIAPDKQVKAIKPLMARDLTFLQKPVSKVHPLPHKERKKVRFSERLPEVHVFEIEPGNQMKEIKYIKSTLVDNCKKSIFSLGKITLLKILRWNPHWLDEQVTNTEPPPILGHNNIPLAKFNSYHSHQQYVQLIGDLLLMEIWECLSQGHLRTRSQPKKLQMRIENMPPIPSLEQYFELINLSVNVTMPTTEARNAPRIGDILVAEFGPEHSRICRFFFVNNVRILPSPANNKNTFFSISLYSTFTEKLRQLKIGELVTGRTLAYINKELMLFEAMECLSGSPLAQAILNPEPQHFQKYDNYPSLYMDLPWTSSLNNSQKVAVASSVSAAMGDRPNIQMVQGPPGTGKSGVITAIVMAYFYNTNERKQTDRGKILICATSNAAIDEVVIRLLHIRQSLPKAERFKMVRVGRVEAMHSRARDVSSQQLASRSTTKPVADTQQSAVAEQISHIEAKINMWKTAKKEAKDPVRVAYCQGRIAQLNERIALLRQSGGGEDMRPERMMATEKKIIERADIIATTLSSAQNNKMRGIKGRIALCIVDEAGQAIEPETLVPLTLDVTRLTLVGDPQQLPGYICSQRAKKHGLGESLFARLSSCTELWPESPVLLLNQQYRMHPSIADYPNRAFYGGQIKTMPRSPIDLDLPPYFILGIHSGDKGQGSTGANDVEACGVSRLASAIYQITRSKGLSFAVITPYAAHRDLMRKYLKHDSESPIEVNTVDSFQGQERDVVVVSLARSQGLGFLADAGRMNVMLTRAKYSLVICLNPHAVMKNDQWRTLVEDAQKRKLFKLLPTNLCRAPTRSDCDDEILNCLRTK